MADVRDTLPRSTLQPAQQRRLAALQGARGVMSGLQVPSEHFEQVDTLTSLARYIETGD